SAPLETPTTDVPGLQFNHLVGARALSAALRGRRWTYRPVSPVTLIANLAPPEVLRSKLRSFDKSAQLSPGKLGVNAAAKTAIRAGNYILATDNRGIAKDAIGDQLRMLDEVGRMTYDTRHQYLAGRHLDRLPGSPFVLMSHVAGLEGIGLRLNRENQINDVFQRQVVSMRTVPAAPTEVVTHLLFRNADERMIDYFDAQLGELAV